MTIHCVDYREMLCSVAYAIMWCLSVCVSVCHRHEFCQNK